MKILWIKRPETGNQRPEILSFRHLALGSKLFIAILPEKILTVN